MGHKPKTGRFIILQTKISSHNYHNNIKILNDLSVYQVIWMIASNYSMGSIECYHINYPIIWYENTIK